MAPSSIRAPATTSFFVTTPLIGDASVMVRRALPVRSSSATADRGTSQWSSRCRADEMSSSADPCIMPLFASASWVRRASRYSFCALTTSGL